MSEAGLQLRAALVGDFGVEVDRAKRRDMNAKLRAVADFAGETQSKLRQDLAQSGLRRAAELTKTWRLRVYPNRGGDPAALVHSTMPLVIKAFEANTTIRSSKGLYLVVPNPAVWPTGRVGQRRRGGKVDTVAMGEARFGKLSFVFRPGPLSYLVATVRTSSTAPGAFRKASSRASKSGKGLATIVVFFLVKEANLKRRLRGNVIRDRARRDMRGRIEQLYVRHMNQDSDGPLLLAPPQ